MKKGGTTEFRKVAFYPSRKAIETAAAKVWVWVGGWVGVCHAQASATAHLCDALFAFQLFAPI